VGRKKKPNAERRILGVHWLIQNSEIF